MNYIILDAFAFKPINNLQKQATLYPCNVCACMRLFTHNQSVRINRAKIKRENGRQKGIFPNGILNKLESKSSRNKPFLTDLHCKKIQFGVGK